MPIRPPVSHVTWTAASATMVPIDIRWRRAIVASGTRMTPAASGTTRRYSVYAVSESPPRVTKSIAQAHCASVSPR